MKQESLFAAKVLAALGSIRLFDPEHCAEGKVLVPNGKMDGRLARTTNGGLISAKLKKLNSLPQEVQVRACHILDGLTEHLKGISALDTEGALDLVRYCIDAAKDPDVLAQTTLHVGIGGSPERGGLRIPAHLLPALHFLTVLRDHDLPLPRVRVFSALHCSARANGFAADLLWPATVFWMGVAKDFIANFYPKLAGCFVYDFDREINAATQGLLDEMVKPFVEAERPDQKAVLRNLASFASNHGIGGRDGALLYALLHPFVFGDIIPVDRTAAVSKWIEGCDTSTYNISFGGLPERYFNLVRIWASKIAAALGLSVTVPAHYIRLVAKIGEHPTYYLSDGEPAFTLENVRAIVDEQWRWGNLKKLGCRHDFVALEAAVGMVRLTSWALDFVKALDASHAEVCAGRMLLATGDDTNDLGLAAGVERTVMEQRKLLLAGGALH